MPWKECHAVDERTRFVARLMDGDLTYRHEDGWSEFVLSMPSA